MTDETSTDASQAEEIQALSQRFLKLWQDQLSLMANNDTPSTSPDDWLAHWHGLMQSGIMPNGILQGGMPTSAADVMQNFEQNMSQHFPADIWKSMMPGYAAGDDQGEQKKASDAHDRDGYTAGTNEADRPASAGPLPIDIINLLRQLTGFVEQLDQRLTRLEQQAVSPESTKRSRKSGKGSAKKPKSKSAKPKI